MSTNKQLDSHQHTRNDKTSNLLPSITKQKENNSILPTKTRQMMSFNPETIQYGFNQSTLQKIIQKNQQYLADKVKVADVKRPSQYALKLPSKTGHTQYGRKYSSANKPMNLSNCNPIPDKSGSLLKGPNSQITGLKSSYCIDFSDADKQRKFIEVTKSTKPQRKYEKSIAPNFSQSSYHRDYPLSLMPPRTKMSKPVGQIGQAGGKFIGQTTYHQNYRLKTTLTEPSHLIIHKDNKIFVQVNNAQKSSYQQNYQGSEDKPMMEISYKPVSNYKPLQKILKMRTEYNDAYMERELSLKGDFKCLNKEQLKDYVMNILND